MLNFLVSGLSEAFAEIIGERIQKEGFASVLIITLLPRSHPPLKPRNGIAVMKRVPVKLYKEHRVGNSKCLLSSLYQLRKFTFKIWDWNADLKYISQGSSLRDCCPQRQN